MADDTFPVNLMRMLAAELHLQNTLTASRDMFGKGYFALGAGEKIAVDQAVFGHVAGNFQAITPENLASQKPAEPVGFRVPTETSEPGKTPG